MEVLAKHRDMLLKPRYGRIGILAFTYSVIADLIGPVMELLAYLLLPILYLTGYIALEFALAYAVLVFGLGTLVTFAVLILEQMHQRIGRTRDLVLLAAAAVLENFGYRQINTVLRVLGIVDFLRGKTGWGVITRKRLDSPIPSEAVTHAHAAATAAVQGSLLVGE
jgi:hypothetical protein